MKKTTSTRNKSQDLGSVVRYSFLKTALIPLLTVLLVMLCLYFFSTSYITEKNLELLRATAVDTALEISDTAAQNYDDQLREISRSNLSLQAEHQKMFMVSPPANPYNNELFIEKVGYDLSRDLNVSGNSSLYLSSNTPLNPRMRKKFKMTEGMDVRLKSLVDNNSKLVTAYFVSWDNMTRIYPVMDDFQSQFPSDFDLTAMNFYYLADQKHNPKRKPVWTDVYLDPAGKGWMLSSLVPIYHNNFLEGVTGLDVALSTFTEHLVANDLQWKSGIMVVDQNGNTLTMSPTAQSYLGLKSSSNLNNIDKLIGSALIRPVGLNLLKQDSQTGMSFYEFFNGDDQSKEFAIDGEEYLVTKREVAETGWQLFAIVPLNNVYGPMIAEKEHITRLGFIFLGLALAFYGLFFVYLKRSSKALADRITSPITQVTNMIASYDSDDKPLEIHKPVNIVELDKLIGMNFKIQKAKAQYEKISKEMKIKNEQLRVLSITDQLTQLYNRLKLDEVLHYEIARSQRYKTPLTVAIIDIDFFKSVNDNFGHQVGDEVLIGVSQIMLKNVRTNDVLGRWGGEEFMLILPNTPPENAYIYANNIRKTIEQADFNPVKQITISIGLASCTQYNCETMLVELADNALYEAKENGRNRVEQAANPTPKPKTKQATPKLARK